MKRMACVVAIAAGTGLPLAAVSPSAQAEPLAVAARSGLQIALDAPSAESGDSAVSFNVKFHGGNVHEIELSVDGCVIKKWAMLTREGHGTIVFSLDSALLGDGNHEILVKALDAAGNTATATTRLNVKPGNSNALAQFVYPKRLMAVQGVVPVEVGVNASIRNPYVLFLIDGEFGAMSNFAPFIYNWDSSKFGNGTHQITVKVFDGESATEVETLRMQVVVSNPGGFTIRQTDIPNLEPARKSAPAIVPKAVANAVTGPELSPVRFAVGLAAHARDLAPAKTRLQNTNVTAFATPSTMLFRPNAAAALPRASQVALPGALSVSTPGTLAEPVGLMRVFAISSSAHAAAVTPFKPRRSGNFVATPTSDLDRMVPAPTERSAAPALKPIGMANIADPVSLGTPTVLPFAGRGLAHTILRPRRSGSFAMVPTGLPAKPRQAIGSPSLASPAKAVVASMASTPIAPAVSHFAPRRFDIAFDNTAIAFDVQPRVENGLPLAPFRAIFEHTGGTVRWYEQSRTVHAFNSTREIELQIGHTKATVNNQIVHLDHKPYLDRGRTIVPLSFIRDSMGVDVEYDSSNGHLSITSRK